MLAPTTPSTNVGSPNRTDLRPFVAHVATPARTDWWTVRDLARHYGLATRTIYSSIARGELVAHRFGGSRGIRIADHDRSVWEGLQRNDKPGRKTPTPVAATGHPRALAAKHFPK